MKVKMLTLMAGPMGVIQAGAIIEVPEETGKALVAGKFAENVTPPSPAPIEAVETEMIEAPEKRTITKRSGKK